MSVISKNLHVSKTLSESIYKGKSGRKMHHEKDLEPEQQQAISLVAAESFLSVCLTFFRPIREFFTHLETSPLPVKDLCSTLMAVVQWGSLGVPHLLWHGTFVYNGHLRGPVILTPNAERLAVELSLLVLTIYWFEHPTFRLRTERSNPLRRRRDSSLSNQSTYASWSYFISYVIVFEIKERYYSFSP